MKVTFLGTGTSQGVPIINCDCSVCQSEDSRNKRLRTSISVETEHTALLIDTTPDLRQQLLANPLQRLDAILYTHAHADHIYGIDDIRRFNQLQKQRIPVFAAPQTLERLQMVFDYAFSNGELKPGLPNLEATAIGGPFEINDLKIIPLQLFHGNLEILGFRIGDMAYCTDVSYIPEYTYPLLEHLDVLVIDALRDRPHPTHFSVDQAVQEAEKIKAKNTYFIHMSHKIDHSASSRTFPANIRFAYDGLTLHL
jgi:phosphoribosyl 1,2-cyclic phosphate phosphodiesterase